MYLQNNLVKNTLISIVSFLLDCEVGEISLLYGQRESALPLAEKVEITMLCRTLSDAVMQCYIPATSMAIIIRENEVNVDKWYSKKRGN